MSVHSAHRALNRLAKWRTVFAGWQLGTRQKGDPESDAVRDAAEARLVMRAELTALMVLMVEKGVFSMDEFTAQLEVEADAYSKMLEDKFPGMKANDTGMTFTAEAAKTMEGWRP